VTGTEPAHGIDDGIELRKQERAEGILLEEQSWGADADSPHPPILEPRPKAIENHRRGAEFLLGNLRAIIFAPTHGTKFSQSKGIVQVTDWSH
jgi:hypothetical protein